MLAAEWAPPRCVCVCARVVNARLSVPVPARAARTPLAAPLCAGGSPGLCRCCRDRAPGAARATLVCQAVKLTLHSGPLPSATPPVFRSTTVLRTQVRTQSAPVGANPDDRVDRERRSERRVGKKSRGLCGHAQPSLQPSLQPARRAAQAVRASGCRTVEAARDERPRPQPRVLQRRGRLPPSSSQPRRILVRSSLSQPWRHGTACYSARLAVPRAATTLKLGYVTGHRKEDIKRETLHCDSSSGFTSFSAGSPRDTSRRYSARFALHHQPALLGPTWSPTSTGKYLPRSRCVSHPYSDLLRSASVSVS
eukprot:COSAG06_NODE_1283_length_10013_cov_81.204156_5_plen_309_part_00